MSSRVSTALAAYGLAAVMALCSPARAEPEPQPTEADQQFQAGMALMAEGRYEEACQRLEASLRLDAAMAAQFRLAECYERLGRHASAWRNYRNVSTAARYSGMPERERYAHERAAEVEQRLTWLVIYLPPELAGRPDLRVLRNGVLLPRDHWGRREAVDPGRIQIRVDASGRAPWVHEVEARGAGQTVTVRVPLRPATPTAPATTAQAPPGPPAAGDSSPLGGQAFAGIVIGTAGLAALGVGIGFGVAAMDANDESASHCSDGFCDPTGLELRADAGVQADASTVLFIAGAVAMVGGAVLWLTAPSEPSPGEPGGTGWLQVGLTAGGATMRGAW